MSLKGFRFLFIALSANVLCQQTDCPCVTFDWKEFEFSFLPQNNEPDWKEAVCNITQFCLQKPYSSLLQNNASCKRRPINVTFPLIQAWDLKPNASFITLKMLPRPVLVTKEVSPNTAASQVLFALGQIWRLLAFCLIAAVLSGIMIWILVSTI